MIRKIQYIFAILPIYRKRIELVVATAIAAKRIMPTFLALLSMKIW